MSALTARVIRKSQSLSARDAEDLLAALFAAELVAPSRTVWLVSPWISDVDLLDNTAGGFDALSRFGRRRVRLAEVLAALAEARTNVVVGTTNDPHNATFLRRLEQVFRDLGALERLTIVIDETQLLHTKALTTDSFVLSGSMNLTKAGISLREETVQLETDPEVVSQARMDAKDRFGGEL